MVAVALCWAPLAVSTARAEDGTQDRIAVGTLVCAEQSAANDVMAIIHDPDAEDPVRRLTPILSSGECSDLWVGETYQPVARETPSWCGACRARVAPCSLCQGTRCAGSADAAALAVASLTAAARGAAPTPIAAR